VLVTLADAASGWIEAQPGDKRGKRPAGEYAKTTTREQRRRRTHRHTRTKVGDLELPALRQEQVVGLEVAVGDAAAVEVQDPGAQVAVGARGLGRAERPAAGRDVAPGAAVVGHGGQARAVLEDQSNAVRGVVVERLVPERGAVRELVTIGE